MSIDVTKADDAQQFMNLLFHMVVTKHGGSITLTKEEMKACMLDMVGALQIEHNEDDSVSITVVARETVEALTESLNEEKH